MSRGRRKRLTPKWYGWIRSLSGERPGQWFMVVNTGRQTYERCQEELDRLYPNDEAGDSAGSVTKLVLPAGVPPQR